MRKFSFPKEERLRKQKEFQEVFEKGRLIKGEYFNMFVLFGKETRKVAFVVTRKIKKK